MCLDSFGTAQNLPPYGCVGGLLWFGGCCGCGLCLLCFVLCLVVGVCFAWMFFSCGSLGFVYGGFGLCFVLVWCCLVVMVLFVWSALVCRGWFWLFGFRWVICGCLVFLVMVGLFRFGVSGCCGVLVGVLLVGCVGGFVGFVLGGLCVCLFLGGFFFCVGVVGICVQSLFLLLCVVRVLRCLFV